MAGLAVAERYPFVDLPAALVDEILTESESVARTLLEMFEEIREGRSRLRDGLMGAGLAMHDSDFGYPPIPTTCAVDGSYAIERLLTIDLAACAAVAMEGLAPPSERRHWDQPHHVVFITPETHHTDTATILRALMLGSELVLATRAPHDLVMVDGTLTLPIIYLNQALSKSAEAPDLVTWKEFRTRVGESLRAYRDILRAERSDKDFVGLPKYSTRREIGRRLGWPTHHDDRGLLTLVLEPGELTKPLRLEQPRQPWHLSTVSLPAELRREADAYAQEIASLLADVHVFYYKPHSWLPALRVEVAADIAGNPYRLGRVVQGLKHQSAAPDMLEPYPLYLADRMVKQLARAIPAFRQVATQRVSEKYDGEIGEVFFGMHGYRSESGA